MCRIGKVVIYPAENSLKDYEIQVLVNGQFVTVGKVTDASGSEQSPLIRWKPPQYGNAELPQEIHRFTIPGKDPQLIDEYYG